MNRRGFTLLEMLVATTIMGIAVVGLMSNISASLRNTTRITEHDRLAMLAKQKMDELLLAPQLPMSAPITGDFAPQVSGGAKSGWRARASAFELPAVPAPGLFFLERIELEVWRENDGKRQTLTVEAFRRAILRPEDVGAAQ
jgi:general secretion pathway protein I